MDIQTLLLGVLAIAIGAAVAFAGYKFFLFLLPLFGFVAGFWIGSQAMTELFGSGFLVEVTSWVVGVVAGIILAVGSYFFWYIAVVALFGAVGFWLGDAVMTAITPDAGLLIFIVGLVVGVAFVLGAIALRFPKWAVLAITAIGGAGVAVSGLLLILGTITIEAMQDGPFTAAWNAGPIWALITLAVAVAGFFAQDRSTKDFELDMTRYRDYSPSTV
ncbi:MAG TPA: DUF4203 domain-containing protein [Candidatus Limnocylindrales bacterium]|jgi:hypothetical protein